MVDRKARDRMAEILRHFASGQLSNFEFEDQVPSTKDAAVRAIFDTAWCFYDDFDKHYMKGKWALPESTKSQMARWAMFLYSDEEYVWPDISFAGIRPLRHGFISSLFKGPEKEQRFIAAGDYEVWPFISVESFERAKANPKLLAGNHSPYQNC